jgi:ADP-dependent NAD(P)H-hydrate dehydratase
MNLSRLLKMRRLQTPKAINRTLLKSWKLPPLEADADKEARGSVLIIGGYDELAGAVLLSAEAAIRAGAGKLKIGTTQSVSVPLGLAMPEAMVMALPSKKEVLSKNAAGKISETLERLSSLLIGPGLKEGRPLEDMILSLVSKMRKAKEAPTLILDAGALKVLERKPNAVAELRTHAIITPHAGEMASLLGLEKEEIEARPAFHALSFAKAANVVVALKGNETFIASPDQDLFMLKGDNPGLATSGSGDVLAGVIAGLTARGAEPLQAAVWGCFLHSAAGDELSKSRGKVGFLARELAAEIPKLIDRVSSSH